ncbi:copper resistance protein NlpE [Patescibacteria group bacterium]|nr:copper resistance protein NlpE [Patescibacteria group bacterium]MBU1500674.1 copper resistance protein NlpE [Patescibacteria group bacterium]MBU2080773.1 copper resistance protein NlpE [Patescibacteria group bacterium]MBU2123878.1 copper resistance protein NlpE [Patescibacteria group bacterium]MBU2194831.1 copper resistance protein NlpE [Patescibacteria group bacterium]
MKKYLPTALLVLFGLIVLALVPPPERLTQVSEPIPVEGGQQVYEGVLPCADCPGIQTRLTLTNAITGASGGTYELSLTYLERDVEPVVSQGEWEYELGNLETPIIVLDPNQPEISQRYLLVDETTLRLLDRDGNEIETQASLDLKLVP